MSPWAEALYWTLGGATGVVFLAVSILPLASEAWGIPAPRWVRPGPAAYAGLLLGTLFLWRWPAFFVTSPLDPDESQFIAGALTLRHDPMPWRSLEGQTAGPLVYYALLPLAPLRRLDFLGARVVGCLLIFGTLWFSYRALRAGWGETLARLGVLPLACFFVLSTHTQFVHYSSEHVSVLLLALALAGVLAALAGGEVPPAWKPAWVGTGAALGAIPFAKLQAVPPAAFLLLAAVIWAATRQGTPGRARLAAIASLLAGLWLVPLIFALLLTLGGAWQNFWISYLAQNLFYADHGWVGAIEPRIPRFIFLKSRAFGALLAGATLAALVLGSLKPRVRAASRWPLGVLLGFALVSIPACVTVNHYVHYLLFLVGPPALLAGAVAAEKWSEAGRMTDAGAGVARRRQVLVLFLGLTVLPALAIKGGLENPFLAEVRSAAGREIGPVAREILRHAKPDDCLTIWGWWVEPHVQTQLRQGTGDCNAWSQLTPGPYRDYFRRRYLEDLRRNRPRVFVDAVAPLPEITMYRDRERFGHETFPELRDYIAGHYELVAELDRIRIYRRRS